VTETRIHPQTGELLRREVRQQTVSVGSRSRVVDVPGWYPDDGSDSLHSGADLRESNETFLELKKNGDRQVPLSCSRASYKPREQ